MKRYIVVLCLTIACGINAITLQRAFHNYAFDKNNDADASDVSHGKKQSFIERGNIVLYFDQQPTISKKKTEKNNYIQYELFIPGAEITAEDVKQAVQRINKQKQLGYAVTIAQVNTPEKGIRMIMNFSKNSIGVTFDQFNSIKLHKGLIVRFFNKDTLERIKNVGKHVITTAHLENSPHVFIDCGHGGHDFGASIADKKEKDINLAVGLETARHLRSNNITVSMCRERDDSVALDHRVCLAHAAKADLYVAIHANASSSTMSNGIETFFFDASMLKFGDSDLSPELFRIAKDFCFIKHAESCKLAQLIHNQLLETARTIYDVSDRGIKSAVSQSLAAPQMPTVLLELGFLTHPLEGALLSQKTYQTSLAKGIATGVLQYLKRV